MKKSDLYRLAQQAVLDTAMIPTSVKLEIVRELMDKEDLEKFIEDREEREKANEAI